MALPIDSAIQPTYEFKRPQESDQTPQRLAQVDEWMRKLTDFQSKAAEYKQYEHKTSEKNIRNKSPNIQDLSQFLEELPGQAKNLAEMESLLRQLSAALHKNGGAFDRNSGIDVVHQQLEELLTHQEAYIEAKSQLDANILEAKRQLEAEKLEAYKLLAGVLKRHGKKLLNKTHLKWLVEKDMLAPPYEDHPDRLEDHLGALEVIIRKFGDKKLLLVSSMTLFPQNREILSETTSAIEGVKNTMPTANELMSKSAAVSNQWSPIDFETIQRRYAYKLHEVASSVRDEDVEADRIEGIYDTILKSLENAPTYRPFDDHMRAHRKKQALTKILGEEPTDAALEAYNYLGEGYDINANRTQHTVEFLLEKKVISAWQEVHGDTYEEYQSRLQQIRDMGGYIVDNSRLRSILAGHTASLGMEKDVEKVSQSFIAYFREVLPTEASLIDAELKTLVKKEIDKIFAVISKTKEYNFPGGGGFILYEPADVTRTNASDITDALQKITSNPDQRYYPLLFEYLVNKGSDYGPDSYSFMNHVFAAIIACRAEDDRESLSDSYYSVWHRMIQTQARSSEFTFLKSFISNTDSDIIRVQRERNQFFHKLRSKDPDFNLLVATASSEPRFEQYKKLLNGVEKDTLVAETLLRHELSFENPGQECTDFLLDVLQRNRKGQSDKCRSVAPPPQIYDLLERQGRMDENQLQTFLNFTKMHSHIGSSLSLDMYTALAKEQSVASVIVALGEYLVAIETTTEINRGFVVRVIELVAQKVPEEALVDFVRSATQAVMTGELNVWLSQTQKEYGVKTEDIFIPLVTGQLEKTYAQMDPSADIEMGQDNWKTIFYTYVQSESDMGYLVKPDQKIIGQTNEMFQTTEAKDFCFDQLKTQWLTYLNSENPQNFPYELAEAAAVVDYHMGAGPLKYISSLLGFAQSFRESFLKIQTADATVSDLFSQLSGLERRFETERWSQNERAEFYDISADILDNAPSLYDEFLTLFSNLSRAEMPQFIKESYPLFQARLAILNVAAEANRERRRHIPRDLVHIRSELRNANLQLQSRGQDRVTTLETLREQSLSDVKQRFQEAFGIVKLPETFTSEHVRSIQNNARYLANFNRRDAESEAKLALFLALKLNDEWDHFRQNDAVSLDELFSPESSHHHLLQQYLTQREAFLAPFGEKLGLTQEEMGEFWQLLNVETTELAIMNIQSVDEKLSMILRSLHELQDPDVYETQLEKEMLSVYMQQSVAAVNKTLAQSFQQLSGRKILHKTQEDEAEFLIVQEAVRTAMVASGVEWNAESIKDVQTKMKVLSSTQKTLEIILEQNIPSAIEQLHQVLLPSSEVVRIFQKIGEDFSTDSGAIAVSRDLDYLENVVAKKQDELTELEIKAVAEYLDQIKKHLGTLQDQYESIKQRFSQLTSATHTGSPILGDRLQEIQKIINQEVDEKEYISLATNNIDLVIENIRACLGCLKREANNDTNLTFGDPNKFFVMTRSSNSEGSTADQVVFVEPVRLADGREEVSLVLDRLYGARSADVFMNHVATVWKKLAAVKKRFPSSNVSVFITSAALSTAGVTSQHLLQKIGEHIGVHQAEEVDEAVVNIVESAGRDHYVEFGGDSRTSGERSVAGVVLRLP